MWALVTTLWISWFDHASSYRSVALAVRQALPADANCIERRNLGAPQRASLDYFAGLRTLPPGHADACGWRLSIFSNPSANPLA